VTIDLAAERATSEIIEVAWTAARAAIIGFGSMPDLVITPAAN